MNEKIKIDTEDQEILKLTAELGMATVKIAETVYPVSRYPGWSDGMVRGVFKNLVKARLVEGVSVSLAGKAGGPEKAYLLTEAGADVCKQMDVNAYPLKIQNNQIALAHRLCQAQVASQARSTKLSVEVEKPLVFDDQSGNLRADVFVKGLPQGDQIIEVEQKITSSHLPRAVKKFTDLARIFSTRGDLRLSRQVLIVFNLTSGQMKKSINIWSVALGQAFPDANVPYEARYCTMSEFMKNPSFRDLSVFQKLEPIIKPARKPAQRHTRMFSKPEPKSLLAVEPCTLPPLEYVKRLDEAMAGYEPPTDEYHNDRFRGLANLAINIYNASFAPGMPADLNAAIPHESIARLRAYLFLPENEPLLRELQNGLAWLNNRQGSVTIFRDAVIRLVWDVFMRHFGLAGDKSLAVAVKFPGLNDDVSRTRLTISFLERSSLSGQDETTKLYNGTSSEQDAALTAISWMLTAIFIHPAELGLIPPPWSRKKRGGA
jgi:hypothetical protein